MADSENREPWWTLYTVSWRHTAFAAVLLAFLFVLIALVT